MTMEELKEDFDVSIFQDWRDELCDAVQAINHSSRKYREIIQKTRTKSGKRYDCTFDFQIKESEIDNALKLVFNAKLSTFDEQ